MAPLRPVEDADSEVQPIASAQAPNVISASAPSVTRVGNDTDSAHTDRDTVFDFGPGQGSEYFVGGSGHDVVQLYGVGPGPSDVLSSPIDWMLQLDEQVNYSQNEDGLIFDSDASGVIVLADGSELEFEDIIRIDW